MTDTPATNEILPVKEDTLDRGATDQVLEDFLAPLAEVIQKAGIVVVQLLWQPTEMAPLLPFQLHLLWPDLIDELALSSTFAVVPWTSTARYLVEHMRLDPREVKEARRAARFIRYQQNRSLEDDFVHTDWEEALARHGSDITDRRLPATAFISVDVVDGAGSVHRGHRPVLGRYATRQAPHPRILVPGRTPSDKTWQHLALADVGLVHLQALRGPRTRGWARDFLLARGNRPTLLVASSPSEVWPLADILNGARVFVIGKTPALRSARPEIVCMDRSAAERELDTTLHPLRQMSTRAEAVTTSASHAWWAAWQSLTDRPDGEGAIQRYHAAVMQLRERDRFLGDQFNAFTASLNAIASNQLRVAARFNGIVRQLELIGWPNLHKPTTILVKHVGAREALIAHIRERWPMADHQALDIRTVYQGPEAAARYLIAAGYYGDRTLDWVLQSGGEDVSWVVDPIEARYLALACRQTLDWLKGRARMDLPVLVHLLEQLQAVVPADLVEWDFTLPDHQDRMAGSGPLILATGRDAVLVRFANGESIIVDRTRRFDVINSEIGDVRVVSAEELQPGDEVVVIEQDTQQTYSERLQEVLDRGPLLELWLQRQRWVASVEVRMRGRSIADVHQELAERGVTVAYATVRAWVRPDETYQATVPLRLQHFADLAAVLGLDADIEKLDEAFRAIRLLRIRHQWLGRRLVRLMRAIATGRLHRTSLLQLEEAWGLDARQLLEATRMAVVDEVAAA